MKCTALCLIVAWILTCCRVVDKKGYVSYKEAAVETRQFGFKTKGIYYKPSLRFDPTVSTRDSLHFIHPLFFYEDGSVAFDVPVSGIYGAGPRFNHTKSFDETKKLHEAAVHRRNTHGYNWGNFRIRGDTIFIQVFTIARYEPPRKFNLVTLTGTILNDSTIILKQATPPNFGSHRDGIYHFRSFPDKPDSTNWLKKKKWY